MYQNEIKILLDKVISVLVLICFFWLFLIISLLILLDSKGPVFFFQERIGCHKKCFRICKFRTMTMHAPHDCAKEEMDTPEKYITRVGRILRRSSLDELPQFLNILRGEMTLIGPRPALKNQKELIEKRDQYGANDVRPGLTGWAQIHGRDELNNEQKAEMDGYYVRHISFGMDLFCAWKTIGVLVRQEGIHEGRQAERVQP